MVYPAAARLGRRGSGIAGRLFFAAQGFQQCLAQLAQLAFVLDLQPEYVLDVEHIDRAHTVGGDVRGGDLQSLRR